MKRKMGFIVTLMILVLSLCACGHKESPIEDFLFEMVDGEVVITGYIGSDQEIYIPSEINDRPVTQIGESAFENYDLTKVEFPESLEVINTYAFVGCNCLAEVEFPENLKRIEYGAFYNCMALETVKLNETMEYLGGSAFGYCANLKEIAIPDNFAGFAIEFQQRVSVRDGRVYVEGGDEILNPVPGDYTILVVNKGTIAESLLNMYGTLSQINFEVR